MSLKTLNAPIIAAVVALNLEFFLRLTLGASGLELIKGNSISVESAASTALSFALALGLAYLLPDKVKATLVFWRLQNPLPGCRAFSELCHDDPRITVSHLAQLHGQLPTDPVEQNQLWYKIYRKHKSEPSVAQSHRAYLLLRDLTAISFLVLVILPLPCAIAGTTPGILRALYVGLLVCQLTFFSVAARNAGNRFVVNAMAVESAEGVQ